MYIIPLFYYTCKKKRPVSKNFFRTPQGDGGRLPLFRSTESCELSGPPAGPLPGFPLPGRKEARCRGRTAPFLRGDSGQCWFIQKGRGRFAEPKLSAACFVVQSCLADADFVVFSNYCLIGTRPMPPVFKYIKLFCIHSSESSSCCQTLIQASLGIRQSPRGESVTEPTFGPSGRQLRLNCCAKKRR